ncbi:hypothetical protein B9Z55_014975 [Caenorhabditis nigoni]|nr:hypothetical protein B9Z55_014975 [Caenorhabditis nigoni]
MSNQNDRVLEMVNSMQSQFDNMERKIELLVSQKPNQNISQSDNNKPLEKSNADVLNSNSTEKMEPTVPQINQFVSEKANQGMSQLENAKLLEQSIVDVLKRMKFPTQVSTEQMQPIFPQVKQSILNAADFLKGASVDMDNSSSSNLNPIIGYDQTNLVLLDRPEPPSDKAWCTDAKNPVLTIKLARYIKPISVSYQHSKWYGTIPNGAPKTYDVLGCLDCNGEDWEPLVSNCKYNQYISNKPEQMCNVSSYQDFPIKKVQFRFRENYGDTKTTCVYLVRVYGETKTPVKIEEKQRESEDICADLRSYYHYNILGYTWKAKMIPTTHKPDPNPDSGADSSILIQWKNTFDIEELNTKTKFCYKWLNIRIRQYRILEILFFTSLSMILYRLQTISNQNDRVFEMVNSMHSQFANMERKIELLVSQKQNQDINQSGNTEPLKKSNGDVLNSMKVPTPNSTDKMEPKINQLKPIADVLKNTNLLTQNSSKMEPTVPQVKQAIPKAKESTLNVSVPKDQFRLNAADYLRGATVEQHCSSRSSLIDDYRFDQTNLVLLDRPQPPADKAWCTTDKNPVLTINLAKYIKPIAVSYQHSTWNGTVPIGAPKTYDVVACLDCARDGWHPLAMNCQYSQYESNEKEQMCNISSHLNVPLIRKVQFRFRKNYGDSNMTCVNLVRVFGETKSPIRIEEKNLKPKEICTDLRWYYHNNYLRYIWVNSMHSQLGNMERKIESLVSRKPNQDKSQSNKTEPLGQPIADVLKNRKLPTQESSEKMEPIVPQVKQSTSQTTERKPTTPQTNQAISKTKESKLNVSVSKHPFRFNAADYLRGASVDRYDSSRSNLVKPFSLDQSNLVILDRPQPPADKAWCSTAKNPVLTIDLAEYIKPISVTYQHSKWNGTIPNGAPKTYDVLACLDCDRDGWKPLAMNCQYSQYGSKEQSCNMLSYQDVLLIRKVQFRFRKNYGDTNRTCVSLVRVYGETKKPVKIEQKPLNSKETCAELKRQRRTVLYSTKTTAAPSVPNVVRNV